MTIESLGRNGGPKPGDLGAPPRHSRRPQPETRIVPTARPKPAPPRTPPGLGEARRAVPQPPVQRPQGEQEEQRNQGSQAPQTPQAQQGPQAQTQARVTEAKPARPPEAHSQSQSQTQTARSRGPAPNPGQQKPRGRGDGKVENRGDRSLYDGGSPSANRLGPAKAMRARDVSRPRDW